MKRDWDLIRDILTAIEEDKLLDFYQNGGPSNLWRYGLNSDEIAQELINRRKNIDLHVRLLIDAKYISWINSNIQDNFDLSRESNERASSFFKKPVKVFEETHGYVFSYENLQMSMSGFDLLEHMNNPKVWEKIKELAGKTGEKLTLDLVSFALPKIVAKVASVTDLL